MLPSGLCVIADRARSVLPLPTAVQQIVQAGARWVRIREPALDLFGYVALCRAVIDDSDAPRVTWTVRPTAYLLLQSLYPETRFGVHLTARDPDWRAELDAGVDAVLVGRSAHVGDALPSKAAEHPHYLLLSPVFATESKPTAVPIGLEALTRTAKASGRPVVALGGITAERVAACRAAGASAVAVCGAVLGSEQPGDVVRALLTECADDVQTTGLPYTGNSISR